MTTPPLDDPAGAPAEVHLSGETSLLRTDFNGHRPEDDGVVRSGNTAEDLDDQLAAAARRVFLDRSMVRPGPGLLPFGARARTRRDTRRRIDAAHQQARTDLQDLIRQHHTAADPPAPGGRGRGVPRWAVALLAAGIVLAVPAVGWLTHTTGTNPPPPAAGASAPAGEVSGPVLSAEHDSQLAAVSNVDAIPSDAPLAIPTVAADVSSPVAAAWSWLIAWCRFDYRDNPHTATETIRALMTEKGWKQFSTERDAWLATDWEGIVEARAGGFCTDVLVTVSTRVPRTSDTAVIGMTATRTITAPDTGSFDEPVTRRHWVVRGPDGVWRVDVTAGHT